MLLCKREETSLIVIEKFFLVFIPLFVAIDPIGVVAIFIGLGTTASRENRQRQAFLGIVTGLSHCRRIHLSRTNHF